MKYQSSSKGAVEISEMATPWLANSWRKVGRQIIDVQTKDEHSELVAVHQAMEDELIARGCTFNAETLQWTFPERPQP